MLAQWGTRSRWSRIGGGVASHLEHLLLGVLALLSTGAAITTETPSSLAVDLPVYAVAATALRWPRLGGPCGEDRALPLWPALDKIGFLDAG